MREFIRWKGWGKAKGLEKMEGRGRGRAVTELTCVMATLVEYKSPGLIFSCQNFGGKFKHHSTGFCLSDTGRYFLKIYNFHEELNELRHAKYGQDIYALSEDDVRCVAFTLLIKLCPSSWGRTPPALLGNSREDDFHLRQLLLVEVLQVLLDPHNKLHTLDVPGSFPPQ